MSEAGVKKAAILMLALGQDEAAEVMKFLEPREVHKLGIAMSAMKSVSNELLETVLNDFHQETKSNTSLGVDSDDYIRNVLTKALGDSKANSLINRILIKKETGGFESLKWMDGWKVGSRTDSTRASTDNRHHPATTGALPRQRHNNRTHRANP